ncbi:unnamed protein product [Cuscuta epithymum]|uniref:Transcription factor MYC/MYB N-terminal domain-containing protein n=1 Tax=Cuscuta epithymum TaxID=186058 RepID=A0AAV0GGG4_9ASTE|nr:unnamed protein product [Cuscuta epithymum]
MEEQQQLSSLAVTHLLQHTLRSLCIHESSQWVYAVFWRILPRNYPPPKWDTQGSAYDRSRGNRRNWILVWEDGFCNFAAAGAAVEMNAEDQCGAGHDGLQPELFFKMSHEIYNYGEGMIGKVAADHSHKWIYKEPNDQEINFLSAWHHSADSHPRTWEAQFRSGIKTIALIAVREGVIQLGAVHKVIEDLSYVVLLRKKLSYIESIPGVLLPHPSSSPAYGVTPPQEPWLSHFPAANIMAAAPPSEYYDHSQPAAAAAMMVKITPSMSSLEALLSKLPSVLPVPGNYSDDPSHYLGPPQEMVAKEEYEEENNNKYRCCRSSSADNNNKQAQDVGESSSSMSYTHHFGYHYDLNYN